MNSASLANLRPELQHRIGVPQPNPKLTEKLRITSLLQKKLYEKTIGEITRAENVADALIRFAEAGNIHAIKELLDRTEGPVVQKLEVTEVRVVEAMARIISAYVPLELQPQAIKQLVSEIKTFDVPGHLLESDSGSNVVPDAEFTTQPDSGIAIPGV